MTQALKSIADRFESTLETTPFGQGAVWYSVRREAFARASKNHIPGGLHLAFGVARISTHHQFLGGFETDKPVITAFIAPPEGALFDTWVGGGLSRSFGLHIGDVESSCGDPCLEAITDVLRDKPMVVMDGKAAQWASGLRAPIDPWFSGDSRTLMFQAKAMELIAVVAEALSDKHKTQIRNLDLRRAEAVRDYVQIHLEADLRLETIASEVGTNVRSLTTAFRQVFGVSIGEYILKQRMEEAARLFARGASVKEAARRVGYTPNALSAAFNKYFGYAPSHHFR